MNDAQEIKEMENFNYNLYSRQIGTFGMNTMKKLIKLKVLIIGLKGLGVEVAKNIILSGPKEVFIFDPKIITINDLGSNFYLNEENIGIKRRDEACLDNLKKLNPYTNVSILKYRENKDEDLLNYFKYFNIIVITEFKKKEEIFKINYFCRKNKIGFIYGVNFGLTGFLFNDFTDEHFILDRDGKEYKKYFCKEISNDKNAKVILDEKSENILLKINSFVIFTGVEGMIELNNIEPIKIINKEKNILTLDLDTTYFGKYLNRGYISQAKIPIKKNYKSFEERFEIPYEEENQFNEQDYQKEGRNELLFICLKGLNEFCINNNGNLPDINNYEHAKKFIEITKRIYETEKKKNLFWTNKIQLWDEKIVEKYSLWSRCEIPCLTSFLGGLISQEIIKFTGKYIPIDQWLFFDFFEAIEALENQKLINKKIVEDRKIIINSRYNDLISIFGNEVFNELKKKNIFMIGAGAVGCEFLKNLSLLGFSTNKLDNENKNGIITVTDHDNIEVSNLNRQFLFHQENVHQPKSKCASEAAKKINKNLNIKYYTDLVCYENEYLFNDEFWINQDYIICAVDSIEGRKYIDQMCTKYDKILTDSGTNGIEGRFQLIIPYLTTCINDKEYKVKVEPSCTIKSYPTKFEHCVEWSKSFFNDEFNLKINELIQFLNKQNLTNNFDELNYKRTEENEKINKIFNYIILIDEFEKSKNINIFKEYGLYQFNILFKERINSLFQINPKLTNNEINSFWNNKKIPHILEFDKKDSFCNLFLESYCKIMCRLFGIKYIISDMIITGNKIKFYSEKEFNEKGIDFFLRYLKNIKIPDYYKKQIKSEIFDKDDIYNSHLDFIFSCSVLRARNYNIPEESINKTHLISGDITPSIPSINPILAGLLSLYLIILSYTKDLKYLHKGFFDLSENIFCILSLSPPKIMEDETENIYLKKPIISIPKGFTRWTKIYIKGTKTCKEFIDWIKEIYNVNVHAIFIDDIHIYQKYNTKNEKRIKEMNENLQNSIESIYFKKLKKLNLIKNHKLNKLFIKINGRRDDAYINMPLFHYEY